MRQVYEYFMVYSFLLIPLLIVSLYLCSYYQLGLDWFNLFNDQLNEVVLLFLCLPPFLSLSLLLKTLPENKYRALMRRYWHDYIIYGGVLSGICGIFSGVLLYLFQAPQIFLNAVVLFVLAQVIYTSYRGLLALKYSYLAD